MAALNEFGLIETIGEEDEVPNLEEDTDSDEEVIVY